MFQVVTVTDMKWLEIEDQELFMKTNEEQFTVFTTNDQRLKFQINIRNLSFCFIDLNFYSNRYEDLISVISPLNAELLNSSKKCYLIKNGSSVFTFL